jgi:hypothetical protein
VIGIQIDKPEGAFRPAFDSGQHFIILPAQIIWWRIMGPIHAHENTQSLDIEAVSEG